MVSHGLGGASVAGALRACWGTVALASVALAGVLLVGCAPPEVKPEVAIPQPPAGVADLNSFLEEVRARHGLPGVAAAVFDTNGLIAVGAAGTRKVGSDVPLIYTDKIQIASIAKTMTATLIAQLVESGRVSWDTSLPEIFPELDSSMQPAFRTVTVDLLLRHAAGLPRWMRNDDVVKEWVRTHRGLTNTGRRYEAVKYILAQPPEFPPGSGSHYTNDSYLVLGGICERIAGRSYEDLVREQIFLPLDMPSAGFEEPWSDASLAHPWGHEKRGQRFVPYEPDPDGYGGVSFGTPYGVGIHASVVDLATYGTYHLRGDLGLEGGLSAGAFRHLHHAPPEVLPPATQVPAAGFFNEGQVDPEGRWTNVQHWGYYARGRTLLWFTPQAHVGAVILTNGTDEDEVRGMQPMSEIVIELFQTYRGRAE